MEGRTDFLKELGKDAFFMTILFLGSVFAVYKASPTIRDLYFLVPLALFFVMDRKMYFWFAYFFILANAPAGLFANKTIAAQFRLPFYTITSGFSFTPIDLFLFISIYKALRRTVKVKLHLNKPLLLLLLFFVTVSIPVSFFLGTETSQFVNSLRSFFFYAVIFSMLRLYGGYEDLFKFGYLLVPYLLLILFDQLYLINTSSPFISVLDPSMIERFVKNSVTGDVRAQVAGILIVFYLLIFAFQVRGLKKYELFPAFSATLVFLTVGTFILSATRSWITMGFATLLAYAFMERKGLRFSVQLGVIGLLLACVLIFSGIIEIEFLENIYKRYAVMLDFARTGDYRQADTFSGRIDDDIPRLLIGYMKSPLLGVGLSKYFPMYYSNDLGFFNTLLIYGVVGFPIFIYFLVRYMLQLNKLRLYTYYNDAERNVFSGLLLGFLAMMIGYLLTWDFFTYYPFKVFFVSLLFASGDLIINRREERTGHEHTEKPELLD